MFGQMLNQPKSKSARERVNHTQRFSRGTLIEAPIKEIQYFFSSNLVMRLNIVIDCGKKLKCAQRSIYSIYIFPNGIYSI